MFVHLIELQELLGNPYEFIGNDLTAWTINTVYV